MEEEYAEDVDLILFSPPISKGVRDLRSKLCVAKSMEA
jgi:hypothetical protein